MAYVRSLDGILVAVQVLLVPGQPREHCVARRPLGRLVGEQGPDGGGLLVPAVVVEPGEDAQACRRGVIEGQ